MVQPNAPRRCRTAACISGGPNCPADSGPDYDFGSSALLLHLANGKDILTAGQKSGVVYALDPDQKGNLWQTRVGKGRRRRDRVGDGERRPGSDAGRIRFAHGYGRACGTAWQCDV